MKERVFRFRAIEKAIAASRPGFRVLDVGCGRGDNLRRLVRYGGDVTGLEPNAERAAQARSLAPVEVGSGESMPFDDESFDMVYASHMLHHARDIDAVLAEFHRVLVPGGCAFIIESIDDSPIMRIARAIQPSWDDDPVLSRFRYDKLSAALERAHLHVRSGSKFNWLYFAWEPLPMAVRPLDLLTPLFIGLEVALHRPLGTRFGGHCWLVAEKPGPGRFPVIA